MLSPLKSCPGKSDRETVSRWIGTMLRKSTSGVLRVKKRWLRPVNDYKNHKINIRQRKIFGLSKLVVFSFALLKKSYKIIFSFEQVRFVLSFLKRSFYSIRLKFK